MKKPLPDTEFMDDLDALKVLTPSRAANLFLYTICALVVIFFVWAAFSKVDEISRGSGQVVPSIDAQIIQSLEGGIVQELLVKEGDLVKKNQVLVRLRDIGFASEERGTTAKLLSLQARKARLEAEANGTPFVLSEDIKKQAPKIAATEEQLYNSRQQEYQNALMMIDNKNDSVSAQIQELNAQMNRDNQNIGLIQKELTITRRMVEQKATPQIEAIRLERELNDAQGSLRAAKERKTGLEADLKTASKEKKDQADKFKSQALGELNITQTELTGLEESLKNIGDKVNRAEIRSPVDGIVNKIAVTTVGGVVEPAMRLAEIIPVGDDLKITARVTPNDIAFLTVGQPARVRISAYDSQRYGYLEGELIRVGANSVRSDEDTVYFEIEVRTDKNFLGSPEKPLPITAGMVAEVDIITGKKSILEYLLRPVMRLKDRALTER
jgi:adhesin transport system membrane fusion protein